MATIAREILEQFAWICQTPHPPGKEAALRGRIIDRLRGLGLNPWTDARGNLACDLPASPGCIQGPLTAVQAHLDMVCAAGSAAYVPERDPIKPIERDGFLCTAGESSLGADCGAGAAVLQNPPARLGTKPAAGPDCPPRVMVQSAAYKLCLAGVALCAPPVLLFSPEILAMAADRGLPEAFAPLCVVLGSAASAAGRLACPALSDKAGRKPVLYGVCLGLGIGSAFFAWARGWFFVAAYALLTFFYSGGAAVQPALNTDLFGLRHAGVNYGFLALGMSAGSLLSYAGSQLLPLPARHLAAGVCAAAGLLLAVAQQVSPLLQWLHALDGALPGQGISCLLRVLGIALISQLAGDICREAGLAAAATASELCGRVLVLLQALPLLQQLLDSYAGYLQ